MNDPVMPAWQGWMIVAVYGAVMIVLAWWTGRRDVLSKDQFLVAGRRLGVWGAALSIAATWIWAPALFIASERAYSQGWVGLFWFTVPNVACLIIFAFFAARMRGLLPEGFTLSHYMRTRYSKRVQVLYGIQLGGLAICSFAVQLLAGGKVISLLCGVPFWPVTLALAGIALLYSLLNGLRASVVTDQVQMVLILLIIALAVPWVLYEAGTESLLQGLNGPDGKFNHLFAGEGLWVSYSFGIPVTIGLLAGPFGDQSFWQRSFGIKQDRIVPAFVLGALIFAIVPLSLSILGFVAQGSGLETQANEQVNVLVVRSFLPAWVMVPFVFMLLSGLVSTLDSNLCAISSLIGHDLTLGRVDDDVQIVRWARVGMVLLALAGIGLANTPGLKVLYLFLFYGTLRASTLLPTVFSLIWLRLPERAVFYGILGSIGLGLPVFAYGNFAGKIHWAVAGALITVGVSGLSVGIGHIRTLYIGK